jgi:SprB repeat/CHU_C Type IX secretion signal domain
MQRLIYLFLLGVFLPFLLKSQTLSPGDIAVLGVSANTFDCGGPSGGDEISFVCFKNIETGDSIDITDNGWERCNAGQWGDTEGVIRFKRTGTTIFAGTVITYKHQSTGSFGTYEFISPDAGWSASNLNINSLATAVNMNDGGDQLFFMAGGDWNNTGTVIDHDATYTGKILFGFNSKSTWQANCNSSPTKNSNLHPDIEDCFHMEPTGASDYAKYTGPLTSADRLTWVNRIRNQSNWSFFPTCTVYQNTAPNFANGLQMTILPTQIGILGGVSGVCLGDTALLSILLPNNGGPFGVTWANTTTETTVSSVSNGSPLPVIPTASEVYSIVALTDVNGCTIRADFGVNFFLELYPNDTLFENETTCIQSETGIFIQRFNNRFGCDSLLIKTVLFDSLFCAIEADINATGISCNGANDGKIVLNVSYCNLPMSYQWQSIGTSFSGSGIFTELNKPDTLQNLTAGNYKITFTDVFGNQQILDTLLIEPPGMSGQIGVLSDFNGFDIRCAGENNGRVAAAVSGGTPSYTFLWSSGETQALADSLSAGVQTLTITDAQGCSVQYSVTLDEPPPLNAEIELTTEICFGKNDASVSVENLQGGVMPYKVLFENIDITNGAFIDQLSPGIYQVRIEDDNNCFQDFAAFLPVGPTFDLEIGQDTAVFTGDSIVLNLQSERVLDTLLLFPSTYLQQLNEDQFLFFPQQGTLFNIIGIDENGCTSSDTIFVGVKKFRNVFAPNVFAPDGQLPENQRFTLYTDRGVTQITNFQIFDRFGELVFSKETLVPNQFFDGWDGMIGKKKAALGIYVWSAELIYTDGKKKKEKGDVLLVR